MLDGLLAHGEGKTLEFKENANSIDGILKSVIAFANTAEGLRLNVLTLRNLMRSR